MKRFSCWPEIDENHAGAERRSTLRLALVRPMKILLSAIACNPYTGSEGFAGWAAVRCLARDHDLWVIVGQRHRLDLERAKAEGLVPKNVHLIYAGQFKEYHRNRIMARLQSWNEYINFSRVILDIAREFHRTVGFDLVHHVTITTWRVASPLWKLGIPFVFGPIGGNEQFPLRLFPILSPSAMGFELLRMFSNAASGFSPSVRACMRHSSHVFAANSETEHLVRKLRGSSFGVSRLMQAFYSAEGIQAFTCHANLREPNGPLRLFAGGYLEGRKGVALAIHALARVKARGVSFRYWVGNNGPEFPYLKKLAQHYGLQEEIAFGFLPSADYRKELGATHVYLLPSLRDSVGATLMEAMLAGCVPIVADCGGPGNIVTEDCGYKISVSTRERMVEELAGTIVNIDRNREIILKKGAAAVRRIVTNFTEENYRKAVNTVYLSVTKRTGEQNVSAG
jgi:glycosyltransferase involved in cell wall biosynthesis